MFGFPHRMSPSLLVSLIASSVLVSSIPRWLPRHALDEHSLNSAEQDHMQRGIAAEGRYAPLLVVLLPIILSPILSLCRLRNWAQLRPSILTPLGTMTTPPNIVLVLFRH